MKLGAHMSIQGGLDQAVDRAKRAGCDVLQIFTKSSGQWRARELPPAEMARFRERLEAEGITDVAAHSSYLINLASPDETLYRRSMASLREELARCDALGISSLVLHPGAHAGSGIDKGIRRVAAALNEVFAEAGRVRVLLEIWAGQGSTLGSRFEEIAAILERTRHPKRVAVCFDTCHAFAAGYDLRTSKAYASTFRAFDRILGLDRLAAFHLNDSKRELGSRVDRHQHVGKGWIGLEAFRLLMNDPRFEQIPAYLETPKGPDLREDMESLATLRALIGDPAVRPWAPPDASSERGPSGVGAEPTSSGVKRRRAKPRG